MGFLHNPFFFQKRFLSYKDFVVHILSYTEISVFFYIADIITQVFICKKKIEMPWRKYFWRSIVLSKILHDLPLSWKIGLLLKVWTDEQFFFEDMQIFY